MGTVMEKGESVRTLGVQQVNGSQLWVEGVAYMR